MCHMAASGLSGSQPAAQRTTSAQMEPHTCPRPDSTSAARLLLGCGGLRPLSVPNGCPVLDLLETSCAADYTSRCDACRLCGGCCPAAECTDPGRADHPAMGGSVWRSLPVKVGRLHLVWLHTHRSRQATDVISCRMAGDAVCRAAACTTAACLGYVNTIHCRCHQLP